MMLMNVVKLVHVVAAMFFFGGGIMIAYYKVRADRSGEPRVVAWYQHEIVRADFIFTLPSGLLLPVTGIWLATMHALPLTRGWVAAGIVGYIVTGALWLPAAWLQMRMRKLADVALRDGTGLPPAFHAANRLWFVLGVPAFGIAMGIVWLMVAKHTPW